MGTIKKLWPLVLMLVCGACVSVNEPGLSPQAISQGQRTILMVFPSPAPWVVTDSESKAEAAAKMLPVFSYAVQAYQDDRYKAASDTLNKYVPPWGAGPLLQEALLKELPKTSFPGRFIPVAEADPDTTTLRMWNRAKDALDWQNKYLSPDPTLPPPRDYSRILPWDDALALEVNLLPMLAADDDGNMIPTLSASMILFRCQTMRTLWKHEVQVEDKQAARTLFEFESLPLQLTDRWKNLVPTLAAKISTDFNTALHPPGTSGPGVPAISSGTAPNIPIPHASTGTASSIPPPAASTATMAILPTAAASVISTPTVTVPAVSSATTSIAISTAAVAAAAVSSGTVATPTVSTAAATGPAIAVSSPTVSAPPIAVSSGTQSAPQPSAPRSP